MVSTGISGGSYSFSSQLRTPSNPTETEAVTTVVVMINESVHTTVTVDVVEVILAKEIIRINTRKE